MGDKLPGRHHRRGSRRHASDRARDEELNRREGIRLSPNRPIRIPVSSLVRSRRFYGKVLGLQRTPGPAAIACAEYLCDGRRVVLELSRLPQKPINTWLVIETLDFAYEYQRLIADGVKFQGKPKEEAGGWRARICDPDGHVITIVEKARDAGASATISIS